MAMMVKLSREEDIKADIVILENQLFPFDDMLEIWNVHLRYTCNWTLFLLDKLQFKFHRFDALSSVFTWGDLKLLHDSFYTLIKINNYSLFNYNYSFFKNNYSLIIINEV